MQDKTFVQIKPLKDADVAEIRRWPKYEGDFEPLDYGVRTGGWLDRFPESSDNRRFAAWTKEQLVGFSVLSHITSGASEFYIAIHPLHTGHGFGPRLTKETVKIAFAECNLERVYLRVRKWHVHAISLYQRIGFVKNGFESEVIQGQLIDFYVMELLRNNYK